jgi:glycerate-2-kinase
MQFAESLGPRDVCLVLLSGGASALLPLPHPDISLEDKLAVTRQLSAAGADIVELNTVRKSLSLIKGGGLARAARAGRMITLIISDVIGDRLDIIGSGPTVLNTSTPRDSLEILRRRFPDPSAIPHRVWTSLERRSVCETAQPGPFAIPVSHHTIGNNAVAIDAAVAEAQVNGLSVDVWRDVTGDANALGVQLAEWVKAASHRDRPQCLIAGGETTVPLAPAAIRGRGGRNQQAALSALATLRNGPACPWSILVGGTDGEDGPTDAAGAIIDRATWSRVVAANLDAPDALRRNDAWTFFGAIDQLVRTPSRDTNVMDLAVAVVLPET